MSNLALLSTESRCGGAASTLRLPCFLSTKDVQRKELLIYSRGWIQGWKGSRKRLEMDMGSSLGQHADADADISSSYLYFQFSINFQQKWWPHFPGTFIHIWLQITSSVNGKSLRLFLHQMLTRCHSCDLHSMLLASTLLYPVSLLSGCWDRIITETQISKQRSSSWATI